MARWVSVTNGECTVCPQFKKKQPLWNILQIFQVVVLLCAHHIFSIGDRDWPCHMNVACTLWCSKMSLDHQWRMWCAHNKTATWKICSMFQSSCFIVCVHHIFSTGDEDTLQHQRVHVTLDTIRPVSVTSGEYMVHTQQNSHLTHATYFKWLFYCVHTIYSPLVTETDLAASKLVHITSLDSKKKLLCYYTPLVVTSNVYWDVSNFISYILCFLRPWRRQWHTLTMTDMGNKAPCCTVSVSDGDMMHRFMAHPVPSPSVTWKILWHEFINSLLNHHL